MEAVGLLEQIYMDGGNMATGANLYGWRQYGYWSKFIWMEAVGLLEQISMDGGIMATVADFYGWRQ